eukprot:COSAG02_NODE_10448_length_1939_cov_1.531522_1_plen_524_part_00
MLRWPLVVLPALGAIAQHSHGSDDGATTAEMLGETSGGLGGVRMGFHAHVPSGATADTNGPVYYNGWFHLFAQYRPGTSGHPHYWYHWASRDLLGWAQLGTGLSPSSLDCGAVWTGSATITADLATGKHIPVLAAAMPCQTGITVATPVNASDPALLKWTQTLLMHADPKKVGTVADPTTGWKGVDGDWRMLVACNRSAVCQYKAKSFLSGNWSYAGQFAPTFASECPDFYQLRTASNAKTQTWLVSGGKLGMFFRLGTYVERQGEKVVDNFTMLPGQLPFPNRSILQALDIGEDFGAPKSFEDTSAAGGGRRILFGSIGGPTSCRGTKWAGMQSLPRVITLDELGGGIKSNPIPELAKLRTRTTTLSAVKVAAHSTLVLPTSCWGAMLDIELELTFTANLNLTLVVLADNIGDGGVRVSLATTADGGAIVPSLNGVPFRIGNAESLLTLRVVVDVIAVEAFAQSGRRASTTVACPPVDSTTVLLINGAGNAMTVGRLNVSQLRPAPISSPDTVETLPLQSVS